jgi:hypothetical protein
MSKKSVYDVVDDAARIEGPHGWIQWKGTAVCIDVHCACGAHLHFDAEFLYNVGCDECGRTYGVSPYVKLVELTDPEHIAEARRACFHSAKDEHKEERVTIVTPPRCIRCGSTDECACPRMRVSWPATRSDDGTFDTCSACECPPECRERGRCVRED